MTPSVRVAVIFGGQNTEHGVSLKSAASVMQHLDRDRYEVVPVRITVEGEWIVGTDRQAGTVDESTLRLMTPDRAEPLSAAESLFRAIEAIRNVDVVFPVLHGAFGEDGTVQSVLELAGVAYVGSGVLASAASMDKEFTKKILVADGLTVAGGVVLRDDEQVGDGDRERLGLPVFVKPAHGGSSIGVSRVTDWSALAAAVEVARLSDTKVLVEAAVPGREIDVGVLQMPDGRIVASPPLEIRVATEHGFFDFEAKYEQGITEFMVPADLEPGHTKHLQEEAVRVFRALGCAGLLRVDFFMAADGALTVNEVNTMPGMTAMSQFPRMWQAAGTDYPALLDLLLRTALVNRRPATPALPS
ncbi:D-alanine--D-alanine ligase [Actinoplanes sp. TBRC 11911]|uniref:D-alanine--D-alanine ligase family protein n=1 Tax=Actinoplanes sp. TBRC 11911 TaxID=2729386 RepID=UPI00145CAD58|nr:D-alanine--D-alanine ligase family protein [Actinoplanes sp. TBRC 11911]NMO56911.1 D-alanine--D-alanine ligase [Actinoplanes sp. TBRC 11911]